jgi:hypothetical protein
MTLHIQPIDPGRSALISAIYATAQIYATANAGNRTFAAPSNAG